MAIVITVLKTIQNSFYFLILGSAQPKGQIPVVKFQHRNLYLMMSEEVVPVWEAQRARTSTGCCSLVQRGIFLELTLKKVCIGPLQVITMPQTSSEPDWQLVHITRLALWSLL